MPACGTGSARPRRRARSSPALPTTTGRRTAIRRSWPRSSRPPTRRSEPHVGHRLHPLAARAHPSRGLSVHRRPRAGEPHPVPPLVAARMARDARDRLVRLVLPQPAAGDADRRARRGGAGRRSGFPGHPRGSAQGTGAAARRTAVAACLDLHERLRLPRESQPGERAHRAHGVYARQVHQRRSRQGERGQRAQCARHRQRRRAHRRRADRRAYRAAHRPLRAPGRHDQRRRADRHDPLRLARRRVFAGGDQAARRRGTDGRWRGDGGRRSARHRCRTGIPRELARRASYVWRIIRIATEPCRCLPKRSNLPATVNGCLRLVRIRKRPEFRLLLSVPSTMASTLRDLESLARERSSEKRRELLHAISECFFGSSERTSAEVALYDDVVILVLEEVEPVARAELAQRLADVAAPPRKVLLQLAEDEIAVAAPILMRSPALDEADLERLARFQSQAHLAAIALRPTLSERVTDVLVVRGDDQVVDTVAANQGARLSEQSFATLADRASTNIALLDRLGTRCDLPAEIAARLAPMISKALSARLKAAGADPDPSTLDGLAEESSTLLADRLRAAA